MNVTNKKIIQIFFISILSSMILISLVNYIFYKVPLSTSWIKEVYLKKDSYAKSILQPKLIVTGGSGVLFSVETNYLEKKLNVPVVNLGVNAGLKSDYILYRTKKDLNSGDSVLIILEYPNLVWNGEQSTMRTDYILTHDKNFFLFEMSLLDKITMLNSIATPLQYIRAIKQNRVVPNESKKGSKYNSDTINANGDETLKKSKNKGLDIKKFMPFIIPDNVETKGLLSVLKFNKWCIKNNIKVLVSFPATLRHKEYFTKEYQKYFTNLINYLLKNNLKIIGKPSDFLYDTQYFYDTNYHLNTKGAAMHTKQLYKKNQL